MIERPAIIKRALTFAAKLTDGSRHAAAASRLHDAVHLYQGSQTAAHYDALHNLLVEFDA